VLGSNLLEVRVSSRVEGSHLREMRVYARGRWLVGAVLTFYKTALHSELTFGNLFQDSGVSIHARMPLHASISAALSQSDMQ
jgi:hypothetical protein